MNILFDLVHPADVNLFKNAINHLSRNGHTVHVVFRKRGMLEKIAKSELPGFQITQIGEHQKSLPRKILSGLAREVQCLKYFRKNKINLVICQGLMCGISSKLLNIKILHYDDDSEYKLTYYLGKFLADIDIMPDFMPGSGSNIVKYKGYKELAYLHPEYFFPKIDALLPYQITPSGYVFIREISNVSVNYQHERIDLEEIVKYLNNKNIKIILSIENKNEVKKYEDRCIIPKEPVANLHALINYSKFVISSGDTMAREACLMGVPCIYTGGRDMAANDWFLTQGVMFKADNIGAINVKIDALLDSSISEDIRKRMNEMIRNNFDDTNKVILDQVEKISQKIKK